MQAHGGVILGKVLVFVIVIIDQLHLADPLESTVAKHLGEHTHLEPPIRRNPVGPDEVRGHRALAGQGVTKRLEVLQ